MRRGLISWSRDEVPPSVLEGRVARLQEEMRNADLGAMLVYTSFARPSAVAWLTHFVPYWNEALLVVFPTGAPVLLAAFSKRVHDWIRSVSHLGEVRSAPDLGRAAAAFLKERPPQPSRIGVLELDALPWSVAEPLVKSEYGALVDATDLFAAIRQPADEVEIRLARRAATIAAQAFKTIPRGAKPRRTLCGRAVGRLQGYLGTHRSMRFQPSSSAVLARRRGSLCRNRRASERGESFPRTTIGTRETGRLDPRDLPRQSAAFHRGNWGNTVAIGTLGRFACLHLLTAGSRRWRLAWRRASYPREPRAAELSIDLTVCRKAFLQYKIESCGVSPPENSDT